MYKRVLAVMAVTLLVALYFNLYMKDADQGDPWRGISLQDKLTIEETRWLESTPAIRIGFSEELMPFIQEQGDSAVGLLKDYVEIILEPLGVEIQYILVDREQGIGMLAEGGLDGLLVVSAGSPEKGQSYSAPLIPTKGRLFLRELPEQPGKTELMGKAILAFTPEDLTIQGVNLAQHNEIIKISSMEEAETLLKGGEADGIAGNEAAIWSLIKKGALEEEYTAFPGYLFERNVVIQTLEGTAPSGILQTAAYYIDRNRLLPAVQLGWQGFSYDLHKASPFGNIAILMFIMIAGMLFIFYLFYYSNKSLYDELAERMELLRLSRNELQATFDGVDYLMAEVDRDAGVVNVNRAFAGFLGIRRKDAVSREFTDLMGLEGQGVCQIHQAISDSFRQEEIRQLEIHSGRRILEFRFFPIKDTRERVLKLLVMVVDVTAKRSAERQMIQDNKMIAIGQLAAGVAHELRNPLGIIRNYCFLLKSQGEENPALAEKATEAIEKSVERAGNIIENLLNFSRSGNNEASAIDLKSEIEGIISFYGKSLSSRNIHLNLVCRDELVVNVFTESLEMVLMNLINNAADSMPEGGEILIEASEEGEQVVIEVRDHGTGIPEEIKGEIFNPFFTTKEKHEGSGLGLFLVYNEVMKMNGRILLDSEVGKGTTFHISIPKSGGMILEGKNENSNSR